MTPGAPPCPHVFLLLVATGWNDNGAENVGFWPPTSKAHLAFPAEADDSDLLDLENCIFREMGQSLTFTVLLIAQLQNLGTRKMKKLLVHKNMWPNGVENFTLAFPVSLMRLHPCISRLPDETASAVLSPSTLGIFQLQLDSVEWVERL